MQMHTRTFQSTATCDGNVGHTASFNDVLPVRPLLHIVGCEERDPSWNVEFSVRLRNAESSYEKRLAGRQQHLAAAAAFVNGIALRHSDES